MSSRYNHKLVEKRWQNKWDDQKIFQCKKSEILVSSTGLIGEELDSVKIIKKLNCIYKNSSKSINDAAKAIMTTDTFPKVEVVKFRYKENNIILSKYK